MKKLLIFIILFSAKTYGIIDISLHSRASSETTSDANEDAGVVITKACSGKFEFLMGIFDGHGGSAVSQYAAINLEKAVLAAISEEDYENALSKALKILDTQILQQSHLKIIGSTAIVACLKDNKVYIANIGDSKGMVVQKDNLFECTVEHKPKLESDEGRRILECGGTVICGYNFVINNKALRLEKQISLIDGSLQTDWYIFDVQLNTSVKLNPHSKIVQAFKSDSHRVKFLETCGEFWMEYRVSKHITLNSDDVIFRLAMSRCLGDACCKDIGVTAEPSLYVYDAQNIDYLILATDGLWDVFSPQKVVSIIKKLRKTCTSAKEICIDLVNMARNADGEDDISVEIVFFDKNKSL